MWILTLGPRRPLRKTVPGGLLGKTGCACMLENESRFRPWVMKRTRRFCSAHFGAVFGAFLLSHELAADLSV